MDIHLFLNISALARTMKHLRCNRFQLYAIPVVVALMTGCVGDNRSTGTAVATNTITSIPSMIPTAVSPTPNSTITPAVTVPVWESMKNWTFANQVRAMLVDQSGDLWTAGPAGIVHWDLKTNAPTAYAIRGDPEHTNVVALSETPDGSIWAGTSGNGLVRFDGTSWQPFTVENGLPGNYISDQTVTPDGALWLVIKEKEDDSEPNQKTHLGHFDGTAWLEDLDVPSLTWLVASPNGSLISGVASNNYKFPNSNLWIFDPHDRNSWKSLVFDVPSNRLLQEQGITAIAVAPDAAIWVTTWDAVLRYENERWVKITSPLEREDLPQVSSIAVSANGIAWFGFSTRLADSSECGTHLEDTYEQGVYSYDGKNWTHFTADEGLVDNKICAITVDGIGNVWFGSFDKGVSRFDGYEWKPYVIQQEQ